jgi:hypothetical protein
MATSKRDVVLPLTRTYRVRAKHLFMYRILLNAQKIIKMNLDIFDDVKAIKQRLDNIESKIDEILMISRQTLSETTTNRETCARMDSHIDFVNGAYSSLRAPLDFIQRRFSSNAPALPPSSSSNRE